MVCSFLYIIDNEFIPIPYNTMLSTDILHRLND